MDCTVNTAYDMLICAGIGNYTLCVIWATDFSICISRYSLLKLCSNTTIACSLIETLTLSYVSWLFTLFNPTFLKPSLAGAHFPISYFQLDIHEKLPHYNILAIKYAHVYEHTTNEFKGKNQNITYTCKMYPIRAFIQFTFRNSNETS